MAPELRSLLAHVGALALIVVVFLTLVRTNPPPSSPLPESAATASVETAAVVVSTPPATAPTATSTPNIPKKAALIATKTIAKKELPADQAIRIQNPYSFVPESFGTINESARAALVNILCMPRSGSLRPISGSGVVIDPRGVILTNAHVAQYVLLSQSPEVDLSCTVRTGSPATARWIPEILYIPPVWVATHAHEITDAHPFGSGEHDYALLLIARSVDGLSTQAGAPLPAAPAGGFRPLPFDTREAIGFQDDSVLAASYPAEFIGSLATQFNFYAASSVTTIKQLLTFNTGTVDLISLGGIIEAQGGSSGGAVVNAWGRLIGIITTTSEGDTTAARDLRALTLSYISRDLAAQTQFDLPTTLGGDVFAEADDFNSAIAPGLINLFLDRLTH
jgi:S1-C subfamily serine protease